MQYFAEIVAEVGEEKRTKASTMKPNLEVLTKLQLRYVHSVVYSNLDIIVGRKHSLVPKNAYDSVVINNEGGTCLTINLAFYYILKKIGFKAHLVAPLVLNYNKSKQYNDRPTHMAIRVKINKKVYLVDPGWGNSSRSPVCFNGEEAKHPMGTFRLTEENGKMCLEKKFDTWICQFTFSQFEKKEYQGFKDLQDYIFHDNSVFRKTLFVTKATDEMCIALIDDKIHTTFTDGTVKEDSVLTHGGLSEEYVNNVTWVKDRIVEKAYQILFPKWNPELTKPFDTVFEENALSYPEEMADIDEYGALNFGCDSEIVNDGSLIDLMGNNLGLETEQRGNSQIMLALSPNDHQNDSPNLKGVQEVNKAVLGFTGGDGNNDLREFHVDYDLNTITYLVHLQAPQSCLKYVFKSGIANHFIDQLRWLNMLASRFKCSALFVSPSPAEMDTSHFICGVLYNNQLLLINPLGKKINKDLRKVLMRICSTSQDNIVNKLYLCSDIIQKDPKGQSSCGPICVELLNELSKNNASIPSKFEEWSRLPKEKATDNEGLNYLAVSVRGLCVPDRLDNMTSGTAITEMKIIRKDHHEQLLSLPMVRAKHEFQDELPNIEAQNSFLDNHVMDAPEQVLILNLTLYKLGLEMLEKQDAYTLLQKRIPKKTASEQKQRIIIEDTEHANISAHNQPASSHASELRIKSSFGHHPEAVNNRAQSNRNGSERNVERLELSPKSAASPNHDQSNPQILKRRHQNIIEKATIRGQVKEKLFFEVFEEMAEKYPKNIAVIDENMELTYRQLNERANRLANRLLILKDENGWKNGAPIALFIENSANAVICILGIMKSGLAYVPITTTDKVNYERKKYCIDCCEAVCILVENDSLKNNEEICRIKDEIKRDLKIVSLLEDMLRDNPNTENPPHQVEKDQLAYIIFTSGSSGDPKGVKTAHKGLLNVAEGIGEAYKISAEDRLASNSSLIFDASVVDIITPLVKGATLVVMPESYHCDGYNLSCYMMERNVTLISLVPATARLLDFEILKQAKGARFRAFICTGENISEQWVREIYAKALRAGMKIFIINGYGPTEATGATSYAVILESDHINIGRDPLKGLEWFIFKIAKVNEPYPDKPDSVEEGEEGELYLSGENLSLGYLGGDNIPHKRFRPITHPKTGKKIWIYQTGDIVVKKDRHGPVKVIRRVDEETKYYSELIDPTVIENAILEFPSEVKPVFKHVKVLINFSRDDGFPILKAYLNCDKIEFNNALIRDLCSFLKEHKSITKKQRVPSQFHLVDPWPTLASNKNDVNKLGVNTVDTLRCLPPYKLMVDDCEKKIAELISDIWHRILSTDKKSLPSMGENFYDLGGDSIRVYSMLRDVNDKLREVNDNKKCGHAPDFDQFHCFPTFGALSFRVANSIKRQFHTVEWYRDPPSQIDFDNAIESGRFPIILINSVSGDSLLDFKNISGCLSDEIDGQLLLYTKALSLIKPGYIVSSLPELANDYIDSILNVDLLKRYKGPIIFMGYSTGGILASEIAVRFQKMRGRQAAILAVDSLSARYYRNLNQRAHAEMLVEMIERMISKIIVPTTQVDINNLLLDELSKHPISVQLDWLFDYILKQMSDEKEDKVKKCLGYFATIRNMIQSFQCNDSNVLPENMTLLAFDGSSSQCENVLKEGKTECEYLLWNIGVNLVPIKKANHIDFVAENKKEWVKDIINTEFKKFLGEASSRLRAQIITKNKTSNSVDMKETKYTKKFLGKIFDNVIEGNCERLQSNLKSVRDMDILFAKYSYVDSFKRKFPPISAFQFAVWSLNESVMEFILENINYLDEVDQKHYKRIAAQQLDELVNKIKITDKDGRELGYHFDLTNVIARLKTSLDDYKVKVLDDCLKSFESDFASYKQRLIYTHNFEFPRALLDDQCFNYNIEQFHLEDSFLEEWDSVPLWVRKKYPLNKTIELNVVESILSKLEKEYGDVLDKLKILSDELSDFEPKLTNIFDDMKQSICSSEKEDLPLSSVIVCFLISLIDSSLIENSDIDPNLIDDLLCLFELEQLFHSGPLKPKDKPYSPTFFKLLFGSPFPCYDTMNANAYLWIVSSNEDQYSKFEDAIRRYHSTNNKETSPGFSAPLLDSAMSLVSIFSEDAREMLPALLPYDILKKRCITLRNILNTDNDLPQSNNARSKRVLDEFQEVIFSAIHGTKHNFILFLLRCFHAELTEKQTIQILKACREFEQKYIKCNLLSFEAANRLNKVCDYKFSLLTARVAVIFGVIYYLGVEIHQDYELAQKYIEFGMSLNNDSTARLIADFMFKSGHWEVTGQINSNPDINQYAFGIDDAERVIADLSIPEDVPFLSEETIRNHITIQLPAQCIYPSQLTIMALRNIQKIQNNKEIVNADSRLKDENLAIEAAELLYRAYLAFYRVKYSAISIVLKVMAMLREKNNIPQIVDYYHGLMHKGLTLKTFFKQYHNQEDYGYAFYASSILNDKVSSSRSKMKMFIELMGEDFPSSFYKEQILVDLSNLALSAVVECLTLGTYRDSGYELKIAAEIKELVAFADRILQRKTIIEKDDHINTSTFSILPIEPQYSELKKKTSCLLERGYKEMAAMSDSGFSRALRFLIGREPGYKKLAINAYPDTVRILLGLLKDHDLSFMYDDEKDQTILRAAIVDWIPVHDRDDELNRDHDKLKDLLKNSSMWSEPATVIQMKSLAQLQDLADYYRLIDNADKQDISGQPNKSDMFRLFKENRRFIVCIEKAIEVCQITMREPSKYTIFSPTYGLDCKKRIILAKELLRKCVKVVLDGHQLTRIIQKFLRNEIKDWNFMSFGIALMLVMTSEENPLLPREKFDWVKEQEEYKKDRKQVLCRFEAAFSDYYLPEVNSTNELASFKK